MKKITLILAAALLAISCNSDTDTPKHDVTFEVRYTTGDSYWFMGNVQIGIFSDLDFDLESSVSDFLWRERMILNDESIAPIHFDIRPWDREDQIVISDIAEGNYFIAVSTSCNFVPGGAGNPRLLYRRVTINRNTANYIQRFVINVNDTPNVFIER